MGGENFLYSWRNTMFSCFTLFEITYYKLGFCDFYLFFFIIVFFVRWPGVPFQSY